MEKCIRGGICHSIYWYAKANNKYIKDFNKNKESSSFQCWDVNNLYGLFTMLQKWIEGTSQFNKDLIKNYNEESDKRCLLEVDVQYLKKIHELHDDLPFLPERIKIEKVEKLIEI